MFTFTELFFWLNIYITVWYTYLFYHRLIHIHHILMSITVLYIKDVLKLNQSPFHWFGFQLWYHLLVFSFDITYWFPFFFLFSSPFSRRFFFIIGIYMFTLPWQRNFSIRWHFWKTSLKSPSSYYFCKIKNNIYYYKIRYLFV